MSISTCNASVPDQISAIIAAKGLKQRAVAIKANIAPQSLNDMLNGRKIIKVSDILTIANALDVSPNDLFAQPDRPKPLA